MIVMKFGGSSVESASAIQRVTAIVRHHLAARPVVVVSAIGKTTNRLLHISEFAVQGDGVTACRKLLALQADHLQIAAKLGLNLDREIQDLFHELRGDVFETAHAGAITKELWARTASYGERLSSLIVAGSLQRSGIGVKHLDARKLIVTNGRTAPLLIESNAKIRRAIPCVDRSLVPVLGGFIASTENGSADTLGRGGSDFTASIVGAAINAEEIQIWTDVDGMLTCDPRLMPGGRCLESITYDEAEQLARMGAKVLHPETVFPARKQRVPITIRNSRNPAHPGTLICEGSVATEGVVKSIATRNEEGWICLVGNRIGGQAERAAKALRQAGLEAEFVELTGLSILFRVDPIRIEAAVRALHGEFFGVYAMAA